MKIKNYLLNIIYLFSKDMGFHIYEKQLCSKYYTKGGKTVSRKSIVVMIDGRQIHGGFADRIRGIVTIYQFCKDRNIPFYINYTYPFNLTDFLVPNIIDWRISELDLKYNLNASRPCLLYEWMYPHKFHKLYLLISSFKQKQLHVYTNSHFEYDKFSVGFNELFKPNNLLQNKINFHLANIGGEYIALVFRFQQLLGDFNEGNFTVLDEIKRDKLIKKCVAKVKEMCNENKILVTSDSITFLNQIKSVEFVYTIPGKVVHIDYTQNDSNETFMKSFIDFYMIANARKVFLLHTDDMYLSGFPKTASKLYNKPFETIHF